MKSISTLILLAFIFGGVAGEEAVAAAAKVAAPVVEAVAPVANVAAPVAEAVAPIAKLAAPAVDVFAVIGAPIAGIAAPIAGAAAPVVGAMADAAKAFANVAHAAVDSAGAVVPGAAVPSKLAGGLLNIFKDNVEAFQNLFSGANPAFPFFNPFLPKFKRSTPDLDVSCINGFNSVRDELFDLLENNILTAYCKSSEGQVDEICARLTEPLGIVGTKTADLVNVAAEYCKNKN